MKRKIPEFQQPYKAIKSKRYYLINIKRFKKRILTLLLFLISSCCITLLCMYRYKANQELLAEIHKSMVGETFGDNKEFTFIIGNDVERTEVYILDENSLVYQSGVYSTSLDRTPPKNTLIFLANTIYKEKSVNKPVTYSYDMSIDLFGKITISFNGCSYPLDIDNTKMTVTDITFYSKKTI